MSVKMQERDCAVCLQKCHYPTQLPCGHIFCFLCVKGVAIQSKKCALCRTEIPLDYLDHPIVLDQLTAFTEETQEYHWYYEGRNGWWRYDERSNHELETAYSAGEIDCKLLLAGAVYRIIFQNMIQVQSRDPTRRRRVRRDISTLPTKGIAGIKITDSRNNQTKDERDTITNNMSQEVQDDNDNITEIDDEAAFTAPQSSVNDIISRISAFHLHEDQNPSNGDSTTAEP